MCSTHPSHHRMLENLQKQCLEELPFSQECMLLKSQVLKTFEKVKDNGLRIWEIFLVGAESTAILQRSEPSLHNYVACVYEENWWIGLVSEFKEGDYAIAFMHPHRPSETFYWPERQDECPIPSQHILCVIETPEITSHTGRLYKIGATSKKKIDDS
ncbi:hypothetical protein AVEN_136802-1 [Araneus ventricosus]|uniref:Uncharacterized protein n=1 Tax=Araneus ventricosus TaxID=182803 RepID=A0A4Y2R207_ARAVE|nr:hypothetical protein AVEN_136802-1 [Araneus ventricosus]